MRKNETSEISNWILSTNFRILGVRMAKVDEQNWPGRVFWTFNFQWLNVSMKKKWLAHLDTKVCAIASVNLLSVKLSWVIDHMSSTKVLEMESLWTEATFLAPLFFSWQAELPQDDKATSTAVKVTKCDKYGHLLNHGSIMMNPKSQACRAVFPLSTIATRSQDVQWPQGTRKSAN